MWRAAANSTLPPSGPSLSIVATAVAAAAALHAARNVGMRDSCAATITSSGAAAIPLNQFVTGAAAHTGRLETWAARAAATAASRMSTCTCVCTNTAASRMPVYFCVCIRVLTCVRVFLSVCVRMPVMRCQYRALVLRAINLILCVKLNLSLLTTRGPTMTCACLPRHCACCSDAHPGRRRESSCHFCS